MSENVDPFKPDFIDPHKEGLDHFEDKIANFRNNVRPFLNKPRGGAQQNWQRPPLLGVWPVFNVQVEASPLAVNNVNVQFTPQQAVNMVAQANPANLAQINVAATPAVPAGLNVAAMPANVQNLDVQFTPTKATSTAVEATPAIPDSLGVNAQPVSVTGVDVAIDPVNIGQVTVEASPAVPTSVDSNYFDFNDPFLGLWKYSNTVATGYIVVLDPLAFADAAIPLNYPNGSELEILKVQELVSSNALGVPDMIKTDDGLIGGKEGYQLFDVGDQMTVWTYVEFAELPTAHEYSLYRGQARPPFEVDSVNVTTSPLNLGNVAVEATPAVPNSVEPGWIPDEPASVASDSSPKAVQIEADANPADLSSVEAAANPVAPASILGEVQNAAPNTPTSIEIDLYAPTQPAFVIAANNNAVPVKPTAVISQLALPAGKVSSVNAVAAPRSPAIVNSAAAPATPSISVGSIPEKPTSAVVASSPRKPSMANRNSEPVDPLVVSSIERTSFMPSSISVQASPSAATSVNAGAMPDSATSINAEAEPKDPTSISAGYVPQKPALTIGEAVPLAPLDVRHGLILPPAKPNSVSVFPGIQNGLFPALPLSVSVVNLSAVAPIRPTSVGANAEPRKVSSISAGDLASIAPVQPSSITVLDPSVSGPTAVSNLSVGVIPEIPSSIRVDPGVAAPSSVSVNAQPAAPASVDSGKDPEEPTSVVAARLNARTPASISVSSSPAQAGCIIASEVLFQPNDVGRLIVALQSKPARGLTQGNVYTITVVQSVPTFANTDSTEPNGNVGIHIDHKGLQWDFVSDPNWANDVYDLENDFSTTPLAWWDADDSTTVVLNGDGVTVDSINDKSGNGNTLSKVEDNKRADYSIRSQNDRNTIDFSAQSGFQSTCLRVSDFELGNQNITIFAAIRMFGDEYDFPIAFTDANHLTDYTTQDYARPDNQPLDALGALTADSDYNERLTDSPNFSDGDFLVHHEGVIKDNNYGISRRTGMPMREEDTSAEIDVMRNDWDNDHYVGKSFYVPGGVTPAMRTDWASTYPGLELPFNVNGVSTPILSVRGFGQSKLIKFQDYKRVSLSNLKGFLAASGRSLLFLNENTNNSSGWLNPHLAYSTNHMGRFSKEHDDRRGEFKILAIEFDRLNKTLSYRINGTPIIDKEVDLRELNKCRDLSVGASSELGEFIVLPSVNRQKTDMVEGYLSKKWDIGLDVHHPYCCAVPQGSGPSAATGSYDGSCCVDSEGGWVRTLSVSNAKVMGLAEGIVNGDLLGGYGNNYSNFIDKHYLLSHASNYGDMVYNELQRQWVYPIFTYSDCKGRPVNLGTTESPQYAYYMPVPVSGTVQVGDHDCDGDGYWDTASYSGSMSIAYKYRWVEEPMDIHYFFGDVTPEVYNNGVRTSGRQPTQGAGWTSAEEALVLQAVNSHKSANNVPGDNPTPTGLFTWDFESGGCDPSGDTDSYQNLSGSFSPSFPQIHEIPTDLRDGYRLDYIPLAGYRGKLLSGSGNTFFIESVTTTQIVTDTEGNLNLSDRGTPWGWEMIHTELTEETLVHPSSVAPRSPECVTIEATNTVTINTYSTSDNGLWTFTGAGASIYNNPNLSVNHNGQVEFTNNTSQTLYIWQDFDQTLAATIASGAAVTVTFSDTDSYGYSDDGTSNPYIQGYIHVN